MALRRSKTTATTSEEKYLLWRGSGSGQDIWLYRDNDGNPDRFDVSILEHATKHLSDKSSPLTVHVHDAASMTKFDVSFHLVTRMLRVDPDKWLHDVSVEGFETVETRLIRNAMEGFAPANPAIVYIYSDDEFMPYKMHLWYVVGVYATKGYDPSRRLLNDRQINLRDTAHIDWQDMLRWAQSATEKKAHA